ncbi:hypothetical protein LDG_6662 [Legionella drancourtii LLAP12]|uniref:Uncharacterized protein n=1 Tax=Legionella drancourtii LLAP12 TaxID=658187 RepID=G9EN41_9GAMM|nr:hypothetical protein LDG_6662 [Legionella drancourtii LLAP12]
MVPGVSLESVSYQPIFKTSKIQHYVQADRRVICSVAISYP